MPFTGPVEDRLAIRELYDIYADGSSRNDRGTWLTCFAPDARWSSPYFDLAGHDAIGGMFDTIMTGVVDTTISVRIGSLEIDGDLARCRNYQSESLLYADGSTYELNGRYDDVLERRDGKWLFVDKPYTLKRETKPLLAPELVFSGPEADRLAIRELHAAYADAATLGNKEQWLACWTSDAVWETTQGTVSGKAALSDRWDGLFGTMDALAFFQSTGSIIVTGDRATARDHVREIARINGEVRKFSARYDDDVVRTPAGWRFARRTYSINIAE